MGGRGAVAEREIIRAGGGVHVDPDQGHGHRVARGVEDGSRDVRQGGLEGDPLRVRDIAGGDGDEASGVDGARAEEELRGCRHVGGEVIGEIPVEGAGGVVVPSGGDVHVDLPHVAEGQGRKAVEHPVVESGAGCVGDLHGAEVRRQIEREVQPAFDVIALHRGIDHRGDVRVHVAAGVVLVLPFGLVRGDVRRSPEGQHRHGGLLVDALGVFRGDEGLGVRVADLVGGPVLGDEIAGRGVGRVVAFVGHGLHRGGDRHLEELLAGEGVREGGDGLAVGFQPEEVPDQLVRLVPVLLLDEGIVVPGRIVDGDTHGVGGIHRRVLDPVVTRVGDAGWDQAQDRRDDGNKFVFHSAPSLLVRLKCGYRIRPRPSHAGEETASALYSPSLYHNRMPKIKPFAEGRENFTKK